MTLHGSCLPEALLAEVAALHRRAADAAVAGDVALMDELTLQAAELRRRAARPATPRARPLPAGSRSSARTRALTALDDLGVASPVREIAAFHLARFGEELDVRGLASVRRDERNAYDRAGPDRPTPYLVPALDARFLQPVRGPLTLSSWPLERRILAATSPRTDHLRLTIRLVELAQSLPGSAAHAIASLAKRYAGSVGQPTAAGAPSLDQIRSAAASELRLLVTDDDRERGEAAARARAQLDPDELLWGWHGQPGLHAIRGGIKA